VPEAVIPPPPPPPPPPPEASARACEECAAALDERQEVCVECGHVASPAERRRLRGALPTASLAAAAVLLAASAAYGLSAGGASNVKDLGVAPKPPGTGTIAEASPTPPPATTTPTPDTVPQATPTPPSASSASTPGKRSKAAKKAKAPKSTTPSAASTGPSTSGGGTAPSGSNGGHRHHHTTQPTHHTTPPPSWLADGDPPYDEFNYGAGSRPKKANDDSTKTFWTGSTGSGLVVDTGKAAPYGYVGIATSTPGYKVTVYSSEDHKGSGNPSANGWKRVGGGSVAKYQKVPIKLPNDPPRYLLIYVTGSSVAINEVRLLLD
jgi:hypothetical protein